MLLDGQWRGCLLLPIFADSRSESRRAIRERRSVYAAAGECWADCWSLQQEQSAVQWQWRTREERTRRRRSSSDSESIRSCIGSSEVSLLLCRLTATSAGREAVRACTSSWRWRE